MPLPGQFLVVKLGVSEDYDPTFYGFYPLGTCFPTVQVHSGLFSNSASAQWLSPMHFLLPLWQFLLPVSLETGVHFGSVSVMLIPVWI